MNVPSEYFLYVGIFIGCALWANFFTRNRRVKTPISKDGVESPTPILRANPIKSDVPSTATLDSPTTSASHNWQLEVNGVAKFDIKVEWNDGQVDTYSGTAPQIYETVRPYGCYPINTSGIAPEWADDGISYQWSLNGHHWS